MKPGTKVTRKNYKSLIGKTSLIYNGALDEFWLFHVDGAIEQLGGIVEDKSQWRKPNTRLGSERALKMFTDFGVDCDYLVESF